MLSQLDCIGGDGDHGTAMLRTMEVLESAMTGDRRRYAERPVQGCRLERVERGWRRIECHSGHVYRRNGRCGDGPGERLQPSRR